MQAAHRGHLTDGNRYQANDYPGFSHPTSNHWDPRRTYHAGTSEHGVAQQGLEALGAQEAQEGLEGPSFQGCPQLRSGQGVLGVPVDLQ